MPREGHYAEGGSTVRLLRVFLWAIVGASAYSAAVDPSLGPGVPEPLARERAGAILSLRYELSFHIPDQRAKAIRASEMVRFALRVPHRVVLDFAQPRDRVAGVWA